MAEEAKLKLLTIKLSPYGQRLQIAMTEKGIPFELNLVDLGNKPKVLLDANPIHKKIPAIIHNGRPVAESIVILEYLEDAWPEQVPLMPKDAYQKSQVRFWIDYIYKTFTMIIDSLKIPPGQPTKEAANEGIVKAMKTLEEGICSFSAEGPFFTGDKFGMVDVALAPLCNLWRFLKDFGGVQLPSKDELPRLYKWLDVVKVHPSVSASLPSEEFSYDNLSVIFAARAAKAAA